MINERPRPYINPIDVRLRQARTQSKGLPIVNLSFNELPYAPSEAVLQAVEASAKNCCRYGNPDCDPLRSTLADRHGLNAEQIICGNGSEELLDIVGRCFAGSGDEILISEFGYIQFALIANRVGAKLIKAREKVFVTQVDALLDAVSSKTRILFLANPNNPTGTMVDISELTRLTTLLPKYIVLVIDLAYGEFAGKDYCEKVQSLANKNENVITTRTFSKAYGLAGLRAGWCYSPAWMIPILKAARGMGTVNAVAQAGAIAAIGQWQRIQDQIAEIVTERQRVANALINLGLTVIPSCTNFLMVSAEHAFDSLPEDQNSTFSDELANYLFDNAGIVVNLTRETGLESFIRFSISLPQHNDMIIDSIAAFVAQRS
jgi:histidinol-phosphate aminotransferase